MVLFLLCEGKHSTSQNRVVHGRLSYLPVITYKHVNVSMFADYRIGDNNGLRLKYGFDWTIADDWTWEGWTYADGTTLSIPTKQNTHFVGLSYYHRF